MKPGDRPQEMRVVSAKVTVEAELADGRSITLTFHEFDLMRDSEHGITFEEDFPAPVFSWDKATAYYPSPTESTLTIKGKLVPLEPGGETHRYQIHNVSERSEGDQ